MSWVKWESDDDKPSIIKIGGCLSEPDDDGKCIHLVPKSTCWHCLTGNEPKPCGDDIEKPDPFGGSGSFKNA